MLVTPEVYASIRCEACNTRNFLPSLRDSVTCKNCLAAIVITHTATRERLLAELAAHDKDRRNQKIAECGALSDHDAQPFALAKDLTEAQLAHLNGRLTPEQRLTLPKFSVAPTLVKLWATSESAEMRFFEKLFS